MHSGLLDERTVVDYAIRRGVISRPPDRVTMMSGGVSNTVLLLESAERRVVVKQALPRLKVEREWLADPSRAQAEAAALRVLGELSPGLVPRVLDDDDERHALTISAAPSHWRTWKADLLAGVVSHTIAHGLGTSLAVWHAKTDGAELPEALETLDLFEQLRLEPYFGTTARRAPQFQETLDALRSEIRLRRRCLVLGDFSPKNILVGDRDEFWVIDLEVAHRGDPAFDVAFLLSHLAAKSIHSPRSARTIGETAEAFISGYGDGAGTDDQPHLAQIFAGLLLARVLGSSPLEYLNSEEQEKVATRAGRLLSNPATTMRDAWKEVTVS